MSDIELVIRLPKEVKRKIDNATENNYKTFIWWFETTLYCAIKDSTPLPEHHGRLIDADKLWDSYHNLDYDFYEALDLADTIIEADKSESED